MFEKLLSKLPKELQQHILEYTYKPQSREILNDIIHFQFSYHFILVWYNNYYQRNHQIQTRARYHDSEINKQILIYDLFEYFNNQFPLRIMNYTEKISQIWKRFPKINSEDQFQQMFETFLSKEITTQIRIFWGILTIEERNDFISNNIES